MASNSKGIVHGRKGEKRDCPSQGDHRTAEDLFEIFVGTKSKAKQKGLATEICTDLIIHMMVEEEIFYPALKGNIGDDLLDESYVEYDGAKLLISQLMAGEPAEDFYEAKMTVLPEDIAHHVEEEEMPKEGMATQAKASGVDLVPLGAAMAARKGELAAEYKANGLPTPTARTLKPVEIALDEPVA